MNVFFRELKAHRKALFFWSVAMIFLVASGIAKFAAYQQTPGQSIANIVNQFPKTIQVVFGISGFDLTKVEGYYGVLFLYIALMGAVHAVLLGSEIIAKEERDKTAEFLYARPVSRTQALTAKLSAGFINLVVLNLVTFASSLYFVDYFTKGRESITGYIVLLTIGLFALQLVFFSIGAAIAGAVKRPKAVSSIGASVLLIAFLLMFLINLNDKLDKLKYFTPFKYFDAKVILDQNRLNAAYFVLSMIIIVTGTYITYHFYSKRDLSV